MQKWGEGRIGDIDDTNHSYTIIDTGNLYDTVIDADDQRKIKKKTENKRGTGKM